MKSGWFKIYRCITEWEWFKEHDMTVFFLYVLSMANYSDRNWRGEHIKAGQAIITRATACAETGIKERRFRTIIKRLEKTGEIKVATSNKYTIITIVNWDRYQGEDDEKRPTISSQQATQRPTTHYENEDISRSTSARKEESSEKVKEEIPKNDQRKDESTPGVQGLDFGEEVNFPTKSAPPKKKSKPATGEDDPRVDCDFIVKLYNDRCPSLPRVLKLNEKRKAKIRLRFAEMEYSYETLQNVFDQAESSPFLRGENDRNWKCDFSWLMENSDNWVKVLEGKYARKFNQLIDQTNGTTNAITARPASTGFVSAAERNAATSTRQKCDILNTLAECQREFEAGGLGEGVGFTEYVESGGSY